MATTMTLTEVLVNLKGQNLWFRPAAWEGSGRAMCVKNGRIYSVPSPLGGDPAMMPDPRDLLGPWEIVEPTVVNAELPQFKMNILADPGAAFGALLVELSKRVEKRGEKLFLAIDGNDDAENNVDQIETTNVSFESATAVGHFVELLSARLAQRGQRLILKSILR